MRRTLLKRILLIVVLPLAVGTMAAAWLLSRESTLQFAVDYLARASKGAVTLEKVSGTFYGPLAVAQLRVRTRTGELQVDDLSFDWRPSRLFAGTVTVTQASATRVIWIAAANPPPPPVKDAKHGSLPAIAFDIPAIRVGELAIRNRAAHYRLRGIDAALHQGDGRLEMRIATEDGIGGTLAYTSSTGALATDLHLQRVNLAQLIGGPATAPPSAVNATFSARGTLTDAFMPNDLALHANIADSFINREPIDLAADARVLRADDTFRIADVDIDAAAAGNRLELVGAFGAPGDALRLALDAPNLARLGPGFGGRAQARGALLGTVAAPGGSLVLDAYALRWLDVYRLARVHARAVVPLAATEAATINVRASDLRAPALSLATMSLQLRGTRAAHTLAAAAENKRWQISLAATGGVNAAGWRGDLRALDVRRPFTLRLHAPAALTLARGKTQLGPARFMLDDGEITLAHLERSGARLVTQGRMQSIPLAALQTLITQPLPLTTSLRVGGEWNFTLDKTVDGELRLWRERGDVRLATVPTQTLGLSRLEISAHVRANRIALTATANGELLGTVDASAETTLSRRDGAFGVVATAPLAGKLTAALPSLTWLSAFTSDQAIVGGRLDAALTASGTLAVPQWQGTIAARALALRLPQLGLSWHSGEMDARLAGERLLLERLVLRGGDGELQGTGGWNVRDFDGDFAVTARGLDVVRTSGRTIIASGKSDVQIRKQRLHVRGAVTIDQGRIELPKHDTPTVSDDVVIVGAEPAAQKKSLPLAPQLDVTLDLGEKFYLTGEGLDVQLAGNLHLRADTRGLPLATGSIRVARGTYSAYGQRLTVERGVLTFSGPVDNPGLNILALRKNQTVEAGVSITGTARAPVVKLVSIPDVPDGDKISWLVLGHGLEESSKSEVNVLQSAAESLLARGESLSLQQKIAQRMGVDEFRFSGTGGLEQAVVTVGKRVSSLVYLTYEQGLSGTTNLLTVRYTLTPRWSLQTQTGRKDNAVDIFYTIAFD